jgi:predicted AlkP superfamily pyrophosphatase or phosphodiesterase
VIAIQKPFYINEAKKDANHMTGYVYDRTVPIIFSGFGVKNGLFATPAEVVDIAPTISFLLGVLPPALSEGHVLTSALK